MMYVGTRSGSRVDQVGRASPAQGHQRRIVRVPDRHAVHAALLRAVPGAARVRVQVRGTVVRLEGPVSALDDAEAALLVAANLPGVAAVQDGLEVEHPAPASTWHRVGPGETLVGLAERFYSSATAAGPLLRANRAVLTTSADVRTGTVLRLPPTLTA